MLKSISNLGKVLNKAEQKSIQGGNFLCDAGCRIKFVRCVNSCESGSILNFRECEDGCYIILRNCLNDC